MISFVGAFCFATIAILILERLAKPKPKFRRPSIMSVLPPVMFFVTLFMISYRPIFAAMGTVIVFTGIVVVNNAKMAVLREPLLFSDFALLRQAVQFPRLYVKYIGVGKIITVLIAGIVAIGGAIWLEPPVIDRTHPLDYVPVAAYLSTVFGLIYAITRGPLRGAFADILRRFGPTTDVSDDMAKLSLVVCLIFYFFLANEPDPKALPGRRPRPPRRPPPHPDLMLPDIIAVQSESFFDARRLHPSVPADILANFDAVMAQSSYCGRLAVPAWGANTMRTEFAFLSGLPAPALGVHRFNPYLSLCKKPVWTMAHQLRLLGYRTVCVHPFHATFFGRETVYPNLGFDHFIDVASFEEADLFGPYTSDIAVARKMIDVLDDGNPQPTFIFAITMENHGKWEAGRLDAHPADSLVPPEPLGSFELGYYLRHLHNADIMTGMLVDYLKQQSGNGVFCLFGDHLPSLPGLFSQLHWDEADTDYLIWRKGGDETNRMDISADVLGRLVMDVALNAANHAQWDSTVTSASAS